MPLNILLTNDDGYTAPGLTTLFAALTDAGYNVHVVAPLANQSAQGSSLGGTIATDVPRAYTEYAPGQYYVDARPVPTTLTGLDVLDLFGGAAPDLVISGTNRGDNAGLSNQISGTVNAAVAALHLGVPAIALSAGSFNGSYDAAYANAADFLVDLLAKLQADQAEGAPLLPTGQGLSVNIPGNPDLAGLAVTRIDQESSASFPIVDRGDGTFGSNFIPNTDPSGNPVSEGSNFVENRLTVSPIDGDWNAPETIRADLEGRLDGRLGDANTPTATPLHIVLVNEDGTDSFGLRALRHALREDGHKVDIVTPLTDQSGVGSALTLGNFSVTQTHAHSYVVNATPDTIVETVFDAPFTGDDRPDLLFSGLDIGSSLGLQGTSDATLAAAAEAVFNYGVASIAAVAHETGRGGEVREHLRADAAFLADLVAELQATSGANGRLLPQGIGLSVNLPSGADATKVAFTHADASTDAVLQATPIGAGLSQIGFGGPVTTDDPLGEGNAFLDGFTTITAIDGNYGSAELGIYDQIAALLGTTFGVPSDTVFA